VHCSYSGFPDICIGIRVPSCFMFHIKTLSGNYLSACILCKIEHDHIQAIKWWQDCYATLNSILENFDISSSLIDFVLSGYFTDREYDKVTRSIWD
jgi:hypothetical protein